MFSALIWKGRSTLQAGNLKHQQQSYWHFTTTMGNLTKQHLPRLPIIILGYSCVWVLWKILCDFLCCLLYLHLSIIFVNSCPPKSGGGTCWPGCVCLFLSQMWYKIRYCWLYFGKIPELCISLKMLSMAHINQHNAMAVCLGWFEWSFKKVGPLESFRVCSVYPWKDLVHVHNCFLPCWWKLGNGVWRVLGMK